MEDNHIGRELDQNEIDIIEEFKFNGRLSKDFFPIPTYDMIQCGYPTPNHGEMIVDAFGGTDALGNLLTGKGMWCKVEDVKNLIEKIKDDLKRIPLIDPITGNINLKYNRKHIEEDIFLYTPNKNINDNKK